MRWSSAGPSPTSLAAPTPHEINGMDDHQAPHPEGMTESSRWLKRSVNHRIHTEIIVLHPAGCARCILHRFRGAFAADLRRTGRLQIGLSLSIFDLSRAVHPGS